jgi:hypothetical protein
MTWTAREDQVQDLAHFINNPRDLMLHDPGVGKTIVAALYSYYAWAHKKSRISWVQPISLVNKNREEILKFTNFDEKDVVCVQGTVVKRENIMKSDAKVFLFGGDGYAAEWEKLHSFHPDLGVNICDEPHLYFSGHKSKRTQSWYRSSRTMWSVIPMTGTIVKGKLDSIYPFLHASFPDYYGTYENFMAMHAETDEYGKLIYWKNHDRLRTILERHSICRSFESIYGEDATLIITETVEMEKVQREKYEELEAFALVELEDSFIEAGTPGIKAIRARQIMSCPEHLGVVPIGTVTGKDERLLLHIQEAIASNERLTIFAALVPEQERIVAMLKKLGKTVGLINGNTPLKHRQTFDEEFRAGRLQFVVGSPACMSVGFNWGFLRKVVFTSLDYMDDNFVQAYKRGVRGVREHPLLVYVLEYKNSIDQRIFRIVEGKSKDAQKITPHKRILNFKGHAIRDLEEKARMGNLTMEGFIS